MSTQPFGIFGGSAGAEIAKMLSVPEETAATQKDNSMFSGSNFPSLIQALAYSNNQGATANYYNNKTAAEQDEVKRQMAAQDVIMGGQDQNAKTALQYSSAGIPKETSGKLMEELFGQQKADRSAGAIGKYHQMLREATSEGLAPEKAVPLVMERLMQDKEFGGHFAEAIGTTPQALKAASDLGMENLRNGEMVEAAEMWQNALERVDGEGKAGDGMSAVLRRPEFLLSRMPKLMVEEAVKIANSTPPPEGVSQEQWIARHVDIARRNSMILTDGQGKKGPAQGLDAIKAVVGIMNEANEPLFKQQELALKGETNDIRREGIAHADMRAAQGRAARVGKEATDYSVGNDQDLKQYDRNHNGKIDKGIERDSLRSAMGSGLYGPKQSTSSTTSTQESIQWVPGANGRKVPKKTTTTSTGKSGGLTREQKIELLRQRGHK